MIERDLLRANRRDMQREVTRLALIREARAAQEMPAHRATAGQRSKRRDGLLGLRPVAWARGLATQLR